MHGRATGHRFQTSVAGLNGKIELDPPHPEPSGAHLSLPMDQVDAGDFLRTAQIRRFLDPARYPSATFDLTHLALGTALTVEAAMKAGSELEVDVGGRLSYRSRSVRVQARSPRHPLIERMPAGFLPIQA